MARTLTSRLKGAARRVVRSTPAALPERLPPGAVTGPPDYVGVGAMKAGTTWWSGLLAAHPQVLDQSTKELHFFDRYGVADFTDDDAALYRSHFARLPGVVAGEWTPRYMYDFWTMPLLRRACPDAKLLVLLRDPVDRYVSGLAQDLRQGRAESLRALQEHYARGLYHEQLTRVLAYFPRSQLLVLQFEQCIREPRRELQRTYEFLGLDEPPIWPASDSVARNEAKEAKPTVPAHLVETLRTRYRDDLTNLFAAFPDLDPTLWRTASSAPA